MAIVITPYGSEHEPAVRDFNRRLRDGGETEFQFPESATPEWLPKRDGRRIFQEFFIAVDEQGVHGGYIIKYQDFSIGGKEILVGYYHLPLSEGIVDKRYSLLGSQLLIDALRRQPLLYALGMGGFDRPLPRMLKGLGWKMSAVPFYFKVTRPARFLRNIRPLRASRARALLFDVAAYTGLGHVGLRAIQATKPYRSAFEIVPRFGDDEGDVWARAHSQYAMVGSRELPTLEALYPRENARFIRLRVGKHGWAVVLDTQMRDHKYFGDMRVGTIADCFAPPDEALAVVRAATDALQARGVDVIISNQSHAAWGGALRRSGYHVGPSNFIFAASKKLAVLLEPFEETLPRIHLTRGDGDGPIHL
jgi:hypothetical protein